MPDPANPLATGESAPAAPEATRSPEAVTRGPLNPAPARDCPAGTDRTPAPPDPSPGQKVLDRLLEVRNRVGKAALGTAELLAAVRGAKPGERRPAPDAAPETRQETSFLAGVDAVLSDLERDAATIESGTAELRRLF